jgi:hypothetical protein
MLGVTARAGRADVGCQMREEEGYGAVRVVGFAYHLAARTVADKVTRSGRPVGGHIEPAGFDGRDVIAPGVHEAGAELQREMAGGAVELAQYGHGVCRVDDVSHDPELIAVVSCD